MAVLGSVVSSGYATRISSALRHGGLSASAVSSARDSVGGAVSAGQQVGGEAGQALATAARHGFVGAMRPAMLIAAGVTMVGVLIVLAFLPARAVDEFDAPVLVADDGAGAAVGGCGGWCCWGGGGRCGGGADGRGCR